MSGLPWTTADFAELLLAVIQLSSGWIFNLEVTEKDWSSIMHFAKRGELAGFRILHDLAK